MVFKVAFERLVEFEHVEKQKKVERWEMARMDRGVAI